jgi:hypothetical protein
VDENLGAGSHDEDVLRIVDRIDARLLRAVAVHRPDRQRGET